MQGQVLTDKELQKASRQSDLLVIPMKQRYFVLVKRMYFRGIAHTDLMQANAPYTQSDNVTIRGNKFYNSDHQLVWFNPALAPDYTEGAGHNWLIENNLFYNTYTGHSDPAKSPSTDILGNTRDAAPDAGCYEYGASSIEPDPDPQPEIEEEVLPEDDITNDIPDKTLLRIANNIIKSGGNAAVTINCDVKESGKLTVKIYDSKGREIITLWNKHAEPGTVPIIWSGENSSNNKVGSGIYLIHMKSGSYSKTKKIAVVR